MRRGLLEVFGKDISIVLMLLYQHGTLYFYFSVVVDDDVHRVSEKNCASVIF